MKVSFSKKELRIDDIKIKFDFAVENILQVKDGIIVLLEALIKTSERNIYFVNFDGTIKWRIQNMEPSKPLSDQYYSYIGIDENGVLEANDFFSSSMCKIDLNNGNIIESKFTK